MADQLSYREKRSKDSAKRFLNGEARRSYVLREDIADGLKNCIQGKNERIEESGKNIISSPCTCQETLGQFADMFKNMFRDDLKLNNQTSAEQPKHKPKSIEILFSKTSGFLKIYLIHTGIISTVFPV